MPPPLTPNGNPRQLRLVTLSNLSDLNSLNLVSQWYYNHPPRLGDDDEYPHEDGLISVDDDYDDGDDATLPNDLSLSLDIPPLYMEFDEGYQGYQELILLTRARGHLANPLLGVLGFGSDAFTAEHLRHALPLQRQNAIRRTIAVPGLSDKNKFLATTQSRQAVREDAKALSGDLGDIVSLIHLTPGFQGPLPLFVMKHGRSRCRYGVGSAPRSTGSERPVIDECLYSNLEDLLDEFLVLRRTGSLWDHQPPRRHPRGPRKRTTKGVAGLASRKRARVGAPEACSEPATFHPRPGRGVYEELSRDEKEAILNVQYCLYFNASQLYALGSDGAPAGRLVMTSVDYDSCKLQALFTFGGSDALSALRRFHEFVAGQRQASKLVARSLTVVRKLNLLQRLLAAPEAGLDGMAPVVVPVRGHIVDFKTHDLRFLTPGYKQERVRYRTFQLARMKSTMVKLQLLEWMSLQPFAQFKELYFLLVLHRFHQSVLTMATARVLGPALKHETLFRARGLRNNLPGIVAELTFAPQLDLSQLLFIPKQAASPRAQFFDDWNKGLAEALCDQLTCAADPCLLLNIHLNYIMFTLDLDINEYFDRVMAAVAHAAGRDSEWFAPYRELYQLIAADEALYATNGREPTHHLYRYHTRRPVSTTVLLCSLNRKTGEVQVHNTLPFLNNRLSHTETSLGLSRTWTATSRERMFSPNDELVDDLAGLGGDDSDAEPAEPDAGSDVLNLVGMVDGRCAFGSGQPEYEMI